MKILGVVGQPRMLCSTHLWVFVLLLGIELSLFSALLLSGTPDLWVLLVF